VGKLLRVTWMHVKKGEWVLLDWNVSDPDVNMLKHPMQPGSLKEPVVIEPILPSDWVVDF
jgi:hypothetical protein